MLTFWTSYIYVQNVKMVAVLLKLILPKQRTKHEVMYVLHSQRRNLGKVTICRTLSLLNSRDTPNSQ